MKKAITVGLVEDHLLMRTGIKSILSRYAELSLVFESVDGYSVIRKLQESTLIPEVMLVDVSLPPDGFRNYFGEQLTADLRVHFPSMKIILLSPCRDENYVTQLLRTGAHGFLWKETEAEEWYTAIKSVVQTGAYVNDVFAKMIQRSKMRQSESYFVHGEITRRECEILRLTCQQYTAEEIAAKLFISVKTVNGHRTSLLLKTGTRNVAGLVYYAVRKGLIDEMYT